VPKVPHLALWDRLAGYDPAELDGLMTAPDVVRTPLLRNTIHTVTTTDAREVTDAMALVRYRCEDGVELLDVPGAALADADAPAPVRFLAEYDNVVLSHADRSRVVADGEHVLLLGGPGGWTGTVLVDGLLRATWAARREREATVLTVRPSGPLEAVERDDVVAEAERLLAFLAPGPGHDVRLDEP
jgi:hypothetical protein